MSRPPADAPRRSPRRLARLPAALAVVFAAVILVMVACRAESTSDFRDFWNNARHFRQTGQIASDLGVHNYLPFFTIFMTPWSFLPLRVAAVLFTLLSLALFALTAWLAEALLSSRGQAGPRPALLIAAGLALPYVYACAVVGNVGLLVLFLVVATWFLVERGREWEAGLTLGLAALIKLLPGLLLVFFLVKRRWRVVGAALAVIIVLGVGLPAMTLGYRQTIAQHEAFYQRAVADHSAYATIIAEQPRKRHYNNNALPIVLRRLLSPLDAAASDPQRGLIVNVADWPRTRILGLYVALLVTLLAASLAVTLRKPRRWPPGDPVEVRALRSQFGVWCCLMLLVSPLVWTHYLPLVYWPLAVVADRAERGARQTGRPSWPSLATLLAWLGGAVLLVWPAARAAGAQIAAVAWLWVCLVTLSLRR